MCVVVDILSCRLVARYHIPQAMMVQSLCRSMDVVIFVANIQKNRGWDKERVRNLFESWIIPNRDENEDKRRVALKKRDAGGFEYKRCKWL